MVEPGPAGQAARRRRAVTPAMGVTPATPVTRGTVCVTFDNMGPDDVDVALAVGYPRVLDLLDRLGLRATFFVEGWNGVHHPDRVAELQARGHEVGLHGWVHERWAELEPGEARELLVRGTDALRAAGVDPVGFRSPGGGRGAHTAPMLAELGYRFDASLPEEGEPREPHVLEEGIAQVPFSWKGVDGYYYLALHPDDPDAPAKVEAGFGSLIDRVVSTGGFTTLISHAFLSAVDGDRFVALTRVLERVAADPAVEAVTAGQAAEAVLSAP